jgi:hypothetical protein
MRFKSAAFSKGPTGSMLAGFGRETTPRKIVQRKKNDFAIVFGNLILMFGPGLGAVF